jgi:hypothetical protein
LWGITGYPHVSGPVFDDAVLGFRQVKKIVSIIKERIKLAKNPHLKFKTTFFDPFN